MRLVIDMIRNKDVEEALNLLRFSPKEASRRVEKLLLSAVSNWTNKNEGVRIEESDLFIKEAFVDQGRTLKRWRPAPMGRATRIRKRSNHVTLVVDSRQPVEMPLVEAAPKKETPKKETAKKTETKKETTKKAAPKKEAKKTSETKATAKKEAAPKKKAAPKKTTKKDDKDKS
jgi:large subunit ribosomal protein L22